MISTCENYRSGPLIRLVAPPDDVCLWWCTYCFKINIARWLPSPRGWIYVFGETDDHC